LPVSTDEDNSWLHFVAGNVMISEWNSPRKVAMSDIRLGDMMRPRPCRVSVSADQKD
jgi:hypothetical protein